MSRVRNKFQTRVLELGYSFVFTVSGATHMIRACNIHVPKSFRRCTMHVDVLSCCKCISSFDLNSFINRSIRTWTSCGLGTRCCGCRWAPTSPSRATSSMATTPTTCGRMPTAGSRTRGRARGRSPSSRGGTRRGGRTRASTTSKCSTR